MVVSLCKQSNSWDGNSEIRTKRSSMELCHLLHVVLVTMLLRNLLIHVHHLRVMLPHLGAIASFLWRFEQVAENTVRGGEVLAKSASIVRGSMPAEVHCEMFWWNLIWNLIYLVGNIWWNFGEGFSTCQNSIRHFGKNFGENLGENSGNFVPNFALFFGTSFSRSGVKP